MSGLESDLLKRCRAILRKCDAFKKDESLNTFFLDKSLNPFRDDLPSGALSKAERVEATLNYLSEKRTDKGDPVLWMFLIALRDWYNPPDALYGELDALAKEVKDVLSVDTTATAAESSPLKVGQEAAPAGQPSWLIPSLVILFVVLLIVIVVLANKSGIHRQLQGWGIANTNTPALTLASTSTLTLTPTLASVPTLTPTLTPTPSSTPTPGEPWIELEGLSDITCERIWTVNEVRPNETMRGDVWSVGNTGTGTLMFEESSSTCEECLEIKPFTPLSPGQPRQLSVMYHPELDPRRGSDHEHTITIRSNAVNCPSLKVIVMVGYADGYFPLPTAESWKLYDNFCMDILDTAKWVKSVSDPTYDLSNCTFSFRPDEVTSKQSSMSIEIKDLQQIGCAARTGVRVRLRVNEATNESSVKIHTSWDDPERGAAELTFGLAGGVGVDEVQAKVWYDEVRGDQIEGRYIGGRSGLKIGEFYDLAIIWNGVEVHCFIDSEEVLLDTYMKDSKDYDEYLKIEFEPKSPGRLDVDVTEVWVQCR